MVKTPNGEVCANRIFLKGMKTTLAAILTLAVQTVVGNEAKVWGMLQFSPNKCPNLTEHQYELNAFNQKITPKNQLEIKSFAWHYPIPEVQLEFYTGIHRYATIKGPSETRFLETFCGFEGHDDEGGIDVDISKETLEKLQGRIFDTEESFIKVTQKQ